MRFLKNKQMFTVVLLLTILIGYLTAFGTQHLGGEFKGAAGMRFGIDIKGGIDAAFKPKELDRAPTGEEMDSARAIIEARLDSQNILDREVTVDKENGYVLVRYPWKSTETDFSPERAIEELGSMAHLTFRDPDGNVVLEGSLVSKATPDINRNTVPVNYFISLELKADGVEAWAEATSRLIGQPISIYMDETEISAPTVQSAITNGNCVITGLESYEYAKTLASQINSGALPFALTADTYSAISPILGTNALNVMVLAGLIAFILICIALMFYYRASGVIASIALVLQIACEILMLSLLQITVTLPGIAGIILSIGMGVDANIIISERIREELRGGKSIDSAVMSGFQRAFSSVFDGNITVLIVAFIMMIFGSGAILSFAYTLLFGIIMNFVAGVGATRLLTLSLIQYKPFRNAKMFLSDRSMKKELKVYPFSQKRKVYYIISAMIIVLGLVMTGINGVNLDIEFTGGSIVQYDISETTELDPEDAAAVVAKVLDGRVVSGQITTGTMNGDKKLVLNMAGTGTINEEELAVVTEALMEAYPEQNITYDKIRNVEPFFGQKFLKNAAIAVLLSFLLIILYVWFSFRKIHGLSAAGMALLSLFHDVLVVFFAFIIFRIPIGESFVAVALTILGYSINDTIVIYDRIRENTKLSKSMPVDEMVDKSISQSFTRSLNTNLAVFVSVFLVFIFAAGNGMDTVKAFALPMTIGAISGCYSTICIAGPTWALWEKRKQRKIEQKKELKK